MAGKTSYTTIDNFYDQEVIFQAKKLLQAGRIEPGLYKFPVAFVLPTKIPNTFDFRQTSEEYAIITYKMRVSLHYGNQGCFTKEDVLSTQKEIFVSKFYVSPSNPNPSPFTFRAKTKKDVKICFCCNRGTVKIGANFEKAVFNPGEKTTADLLFDAKKLKGKIKRVHLGLQLFVKIKCQGKTNWWTRTNSVYQNKEIKAGDISEIIRLTKGIKVQKNLLTTTGKLVQGEYFLQVSCDVKLGPCLSSNPALFFPVFICNSQKQYQKAVESGHRSSYDKVKASNLKELTILNIDLKKNIYRKFFKGISPPFRYTRGNRSPQTRGKETGLTEFLGSSQKKVEKEALDSARQDLNQIGIAPRSENLKTK